MLLALAAAFWRGAYRMPAYGITDPVGPAGFPILLAGALGLTAGVLIVRPRAEERAQRGRPLHMVIVFGLLTGYILLFERLGFLLSTVLFLSSSIALFAPGWRWRVPLFAIVLTSLLQLLFGYALGISLPSGLLGGK
ncbi:MAG: tripartite tricarboxylate transporter TctB family protein [Chloroflexi bacterium]|nr:tripartite tricarboxylate transporter TctB family protein [Chloroflexota bacterium]